MKLRIAVLCLVLGACSALVPIETRESQAAPILRTPPVPRAMPRPNTPDANPSEVCRNLDTEDLRETIISKLDCIDQELKK